MYYILNKQNIEISSDNSPFDVMMKLVIKYNDRIRSEQMNAIISKRIADDIDMMIIGGITRFLK